MVNEEVVVDDGSDVVKLVTAVYKIVFILSQCIACGVDCGQRAEEEAAE